MSFETDGELSDAPYKIDNDHLRLLHLSDIHFNRHANDEYDIDLALRSELEDDLRHIIEKGTIDAVLVTGDISFSGKTGEFETAKQWLDRIAEILDLDKENFWLVPGNHDVDRAVSELFRDKISAFRKLNPLQVEKKVTDTLRNERTHDAFLSSMAAFNSFAQQYNCQISPNRPFWRVRFQLKGGTCVDLYGLNTALFSNEDDNEYRSVVMYGRQVQFGTSRDSENGVVNVALMHHPTEWWHCPQEAINHVQARSSILMSGHEHKADNAEIEGRLEVRAGAFHPDRSEDGWAPCYNVIEISETVEDPNVLSRVTVTRRSWNTEQAKFESGKEFDKQLTLSGEEATQALEEHDTAYSSKNEITMGEATTQQEWRKLLYEFHNLSRERQMDILIRVGAIKMAEFETLAKATSCGFRKAVEMDLYDELNNAVQDATRE